MSETTVIDFDMPISLQTCQERLEHDLHQKAIDLKTGRGGLTYTITEQTDPPIAFEVDYQVNWLIGAGLRGTLNGDSKTTQVTGKLHTHIGVYVTIAALNLSGIAAIFVDEAGWVAWFAALGISAFITFLVVGIRQGLAKAVTEAVNTPKHLSPTTTRRKHS